MMVGIVAAAALLLAQETGTVTRTTTVSGPSLDIPDEFAPAAVTYFACISASRGHEVRQGPSGPKFNPDNVKLGDDCSKIREREMDRAMRMLKASPVAKRKHRELVEKTFANIDAFAAYAPPVTPNAAR